jgi:ligand-binding sensor domain-containing protein
VEDPSDPLHLALAAKAAGLWESRDGGANWKLLRKGSFGVVTTVAIGENGGVLAFFADEGIVSASDGKASRPRPSGQLEVARLVARKGGGWLAGLRNDGVAELDDAGNVTGFLNDGLLATSVLSFVPGVEEGSMWCGDGNGVFYSADNGKSWEGRDDGLANSPVRSLLWHNGTLFAGLYGQGVAAWDDEARRWTVRSEGLGTSNTIYSLIEGTGGRLFVGTEGGILRSSDDGVHWERASTGLEEGNFWTLAADDKTAGRLWAAGQVGIFSSDDGGGSWTRQIQGEFGQIAVTGGRVLVAMGSRVVEYEDHSIRPLFDGGRDDRVQCLLVAGADLWVGTGQGLWLMRGESQQLLWGEAPVLALGRASDGRIHAGTDGLGVKTFRVE